MFLVEQAEFDKKLHFFYNTATEWKFPFFLRLILRLWKITRVCDICLNNFSLFFNACFLSSKPTLTKTPFFLQHSYRIKISIFLRLILRLWKITRVCDIFLKKFHFIFNVCFLTSRPSLTRNIIFLTTQLPNKNFDFFALDIATMEDNPRVWYFFFKKNFQFIF